MGREDEKLIATYVGKYGHYEIREVGGLGTTYRIYRDREHWKSYSAVNSAVDAILRYDSSAKSTN